MSITNSDLVADALRELNVISEIQTPSAEQYAHAQRKLNQMLAKWIEDGIDFGSWFAQTISSDICPIPEYAEDGVTCMLATKLASNYGATVTMELAAAAMTGYDTICRTAVSASLPTNSLQNRPQGTFSTVRQNILTG